MLQIASACETISNTPDVGGAKPRAAMATKLFDLDSILAENAKLMSQLRDEVSELQQLNQLSEKRRTLYTDFATHTSHPDENVGDTKAAAQGRTNASTALPSPAAWSGSAEGQRIETASSTSDMSAREIERYIGDLKTKADDSQQVSHVKSGATPRAGGDTRLPSSLPHASATLQAITALATIEVVPANVAASATSTLDSVRAVRLAAIDFDAGPRATNLEAQTRLALRSKALFEASIHTDAVSGRYLPNGVAAPSWTPAADVGLPTPAAVNHAFASTPSSSSIRTATARGPASSRKPAVFTFAQALAEASAQVRPKPSLVVDAPPAAAVAAADTASTASNLEQQQQPIELTTATVNARADVAGPLDMALSGQSSSINVQLALQQHAAASSDSSSQATFAPPVVDVATLTRQASYNSLISPTMDVLPFGRMDGGGAGSGSGAASAVSSRPASSPAAPAITVEQQPQPPTSFDSSSAPTAITAASPGFVSGLSTTFRAPAAAAAAAAAPAAAAASAPVAPSRSPSKSFVIAAAAAGPSSPSPSSTMATALRPKTPVSKVLIEPINRHENADGAAAGSMQPSQFPSATSAAPHQQQPATSRPTIVSPISQRIARYRSLGSGGGGSGSVVTPSSADGGAAALGSGTATTAVAAQQQHPSSSSRFEDRMMAAKRRIAARAQSAAAEAEAAAAASLDLTSPLPSPPPQARQQSPPQQPQAPAQHVKQQAQPQQAVSSPATSHVTNIPHLLSEAHRLRMLMLQTKAQAAAAAVTPSPAPPAAIARPSSSARLKSRSSGPSSPSGASPRSLSGSMMGGGRGSPSLQGRSGSPMLMSLSSTLSSSAQLQQSLRAPASSSSSFPHLPRSTSGGVVEIHEPIHETDHDVGDHESAASAADDADRDGVAADERHQVQRHQQQQAHDNTDRQHDAGTTGAQQRPLAGAASVLAQRQLQQLEEVRHGPRTAAEVVAQIAASGSRIAPLVLRAAAAQQPQQQQLLQQPNLGLIALAASSHRGARPAAHPGQLAGDVMRVLQHQQQLAWQQEELAWMQEQLDAEAEEDAEQPQDQRAENAGAAGTSPSAGVAAGAAGTGLLSRGAYPTSSVDTADADVQTVRTTTADASTARSASSPSGEGGSAAVSGSTEAQSSVSAAAPAIVTLVNDSAHHDLEAPAPQSTSPGAQQQQAQPSKSADKKPGFFKSMFSSSLKKQASVRDPGNALALMAAVSAPAAL